MRLRRARATRARRVGLWLAAGAVCLTGVVTSTAGAGASTGRSQQQTGTTVSVENSKYGPVLDVGSEPFSGFSLYFISSDHGGKYGCNTHIVILLGQVELSCTEEWPPLLTNGPPVAGPGVNPNLLGSVFRRDIGASQVTYAGHPLYMFDNKAGTFHGQRWDEPSLPPWQGVWYLMSPSGLAAPGTATITTETISSGTVLGSVMPTHLGPVSFTVYTFTGDSFNHSTCTGLCAVYWPPVLSSALPILKQGLLHRDFGLITRHDGSQQVTYEGMPLYLFSNEGLQLTPTGPASTGNGNGITAFNGTFNVVNA